MNNSPRFKEIITQTTEKVGPGTYYFSDPSITENYYPFLSSSLRKTGRLAPYSTDAIYNVERSCKRAVKGGSSIRNKAERFPYKENTTPSPVDYFLDESTRASTPKKPECPPKGNTGSLYLCRVPFDNQMHGPSVPTKKDQNGYKYDDSGNLIKVYPKEHDASIGPAYYDVKNCDFYKDRYGGCKWSNSTVKRKGQEGREGPGPGDHNVQVPKCRRAEFDERVREMARLLTYLPRFSEAQMLNITKQNFPGPASYDVIAKKDLRRSRSVRKRPFLIGQKRFKRASAESPSPGDYIVCDCSTRQKQFSTKSVPFGFDSPRFQKDKTLKTPGPAYYVDEGAIVKNLRSKMNPYSSVRPPFSHTAPRIMSYLFFEGENIPSPLEYDPYKPVKAEKPKPNAIFASVIPRFTIRRKDNDTSNYKVREQFNKYKSSNSHRVIQMPFNATGPRSKFCFIKEITPGPGEYKMSKPSRAINPGYYFKTTPRFKEEKDIKPSATRYKLHPSMTSVAKAFMTHNVKLKENVLSMKMKVAAAETWEMYKEVLQSSKKLLCFENAYYTHCPM